MIDLSTSKTPKANTVLPHYIFAALSFCVLCLLLVFSSEALVGHYFHPKLLAITHIAALGWGTMIIFGALYQFLPVILETSLYSERLSKITFFIFGIGIICIAFAFWNFYVGLQLQIAAVLILTAFILFSANIILTAFKVSDWSIEAEFIVTSVFWLLLTGILGLLMVFNFTYPFLPKSHLLFLKIHAHLGIAGWFVLLIMGVGSKLIPMFLLAQNLNKKKLKYAYYLVNLGLIGFCADVFLREDKAWIILYAIIIVAGIISFGTFLFEAFKKRLRKQLDIGLKHSFTAFLSLILPIISAGVICFFSSAENKFILQIYLTYGASIFFGFISSLILGQTFKTLPFIVWLNLHKKQNGKLKTLLPKDLYSEKLVNLQFVLFLLALPVLIGGILLAQFLIIKTGAILLLATAVVYNINVFKILFHSCKPPETYEPVQQRQ